MEGGGDTAWRAALQPSRRGRPATILQRPSMERGGALALDQRAVPLARSEAFKSLARPARPGRIHSDVAGDGAAAVGGPGPRTINSRVAYTCATNAVFKLQAFLQHVELRTANAPTDHTWPTAPHTDSRQGTAGHTPGSETADHILPFRCQLHGGPYTAYTALSLPGIWPAVLAIYPAAIIFLRVETRRGYKDTGPQCWPFTVDRLQPRARREAKGRCGGVVWVPAPDRAAGSESAGPTRQSLGLDGWGSTMVAVART